MSSSWRQIFWRLFRSCFSTVLELDSKLSAFILIIGCQRTYVHYAETDAAKESKTSIEPHLEVLHGKQIIINGKKTFFFRANSSVYHRGFRIENESASFEIFLDSNVCDLFNSRD